MSFKKDDIITFDDDSKVVVLAALLYANKEYLFVCVLDESENPTDVFKVYNANYQTGELDKIIDNELLNTLLPLFYEKLSNDEDNIA